MANIIWKTRRNLTLLIRGTKEGLISPEEFEEITGLNYEEELAKYEGSVDGGN